VTSAPEPLKALSKVGTKITKETRQPSKQKPQRVPSCADTAAWSGEIGQGRMSNAVIAIEEAQAKLADALDAGTAAPSEARGYGQSLTGSPRLPSPNQRSPSA
jgi:hypothetical protein